MKILDVCCGGKMFWFDKDNPLVEFCDIRREDMELCDGRPFSVNPDTICDFQNLPHDSDSFDMVVFDPPHLNHTAGNNSWLVKKYGKLDKDFKTQIGKGFSECFRVLKDNGFLVFKWNETDIVVSEILKCCDFKPLFGHKSGKQQKTHWLIFSKNELLLRKEKPQ